jgi:hypothetical protein
MAYGGFGVEQAVARIDCSPARHPPLWWVQLQMGHPVWPTDLPASWNAAWLDLGATQGGRIQPSMPSWPWRGWQNVAEIQGRSRTQAEACQPRSSRHLRPWPTGPCQWFDQWPCPPRRYGDPPSEFAGGCRC